MGKVLLMANEVKVWNANGSRNSRTSDNKKAFLRGYRETGTVTSGAEFAGISSRTVYLWLENDEEFKDEMARVERAIADDLERIVLERAKKENGSDTMLIFAMKGHKPEKYRDNFNVQHSGNVMLVNEWQEKPKRSETTNAA